MKRIIILFLLFIPVLCFGQNIITHVSLKFVPEKADLLTGDFYVMEISPGYKDRDFQISISQKDSLGTEEILDSVNINTVLTIYRKDYKMPDGKYEWDFETWIKSNETYTGDIISIGDCSNQRKLSASLRLSNSKQYLIRIKYNDRHYIQFKIDPKSDSRIVEEYY